jgi:predicted nucleic acid-binding protein
VSGAVLSGSPQIVVIDASMALAWLFERQQPMDIEQANRLLGACGESPWWVPSLWYLEVANALLVAERRSVLPQVESDCFLARLSSLPILMDTDPLPERRTRIMALGRDHGLSSANGVTLFAQL